MSFVTILILALALIGGIMAWAYAKYIRVSDKGGRVQEPASKKSLQNADVWGSFSSARREYERSVEAWMTPEELAAWRDL